MKAIAIDGPSGAGKSTIAKAISKKLGFIYVDTGALYRAVSLYIVKCNIDPKNSEAVTSKLNEIHVELKYINGEQRVVLNNEDVSDLIRTPEISMAASDVSAIPSVRQFLFDLQKKIGENNNVVMDGRDIGTVVLPNADVKLFLTATPEDRATRRYEELKAKGMNVNYPDILDDVKKRDYNDSNRAIAPLKQAEDALLIDTTGNSLEESIELMLNIVTSKLK